MSIVITPETFLEGYMRELRKESDSAWADPKTRTRVTTAAAQRIITEARLKSDFPLDPQLPDIEPGKGLTASKEYFRVDVIGDEKVGDHDCNWLLRVAFEHENPGWHSPWTGRGAPKLRPTWIQELCKLTHLVSDLRVLAAYHNLKKDGALKELLQRNVDRTQEKESRMTRVKNGQWLFIFGPDSPAVNGFRAFKLGGDNGTTVTELEIPL